MGLLEIIFLFFAIILGIFIIKVISRITRVLLTILLVILLVIAAGVVMAGFDYRQLKSEYANSTNLFVFVNNGTLTSALKTTGFSLANSSSLGSSQLSELRDYYNGSDYDSMLGDYYRMLLIDEVGYGESHTQIANLFDENTLKTVELGVKDGYIEVYPNTMFFRIIQYIPRIAIQYGIIVS